MTMRHCPKILLVVLALFAGPAATLPANAQVGAPEVAATGAVREKVYYVPYEELEKVFETAGRGIFLPYDEFLEMWAKAEGMPVPERNDPPAPTVVRGGHYRGTVGERSARLEASYSVESLAEGWTETRFLLGDIAIESVTVSDPEALFVARNGAYSLLLPHPGTVELDLVFSVPVVEQPGKKRIQFGIPSVAVSRLELSIPEEDLRVDVEPVLAATRTEHGDGTTEVLAFLGDSGSVTVAWMPPLGRAAEGGALVSASQTARASLDERILRVATELEFSVLRGEVGTFRIALPEAMQLIQVSGENLREWRPDGGVLEVSLHAAVTGKYVLSLEFERILDDVPPRLTIPFPRAEGVLRESGLVTLEHDPGLRVRVVSTEGLSQLDPEEIPEQLRGADRTGYRYLSQPVSLALEIEQIEPQVRSETVSVISLGRTEDHWIGWVDATITRAGLFQIALRVPSGWEVESIGDPAAVEEFQVEDGTGGRTIRVSLRSRALGTFRLPFRLVREGTARAGEIEVSPPIVLGSEQDRGILGISSPRSFEIVTLTRSELLDADVDDLFRTGILGQMRADSSIPRAFRYRKQPASARLALSERRTEIDLLAQHLVDVSDGEIRVTHLLDHEILYAAVDAVRFRAPSSLDESLTVEAKQKTQVRKVSSEGGITTWEVGLQPPALGSLTLTIHHTIPLPALVAGAPQVIAIPLVRAVGSRGTQGFVAIRKEGTLEVVPTVTDMEGIDAGDLPDKLRRGRIYGGFRYFTAEPTIALELTRYDHETLATAVVSLMRVRSVLSEERKLESEAVLWMQNSDRQFLELELPPGAEVLQLYVNGRSQAPKRRKEGTGTLIEIPRSAGPAGTFPVEIRYKQSLGSGLGAIGSVRIDTPIVLADLPVNQIELDLYLPPHYAYLGWSGNLHRRIANRPGTWERFKGLIGLAGERASATVMERGGDRPTPTAITIELPIEGKELHRFETLAPRGEVRFRYYGRTLYGFLDFLLFIGAALATYIVLEHRVRSKPIGAVVLLFIALTYLWFSQGPAAGFAGSVFGGVVVVCLFLSGRPVVRKWRSFRAERVALAPDPYLEGVAVATPATPKKPAPTPADDVPPRTPPESAKAEPTGEKRAKRAKKKKTKKPDDRTGEES